jgi:hypothetical protein
MQAQKAELLSQLSERGWCVAGVEENLEWWAAEMWRLESVWSPVGSRAYITFLFAPEVPLLPYDKTRRRGEVVWAVMASPAQPMSRLQVEGEFTLSLGQGWKNRLPDFFAHLSALRSKSEEASSA